jgi:hypothetical protein
MAVNGRQTALSSIAVVEKVSRSRKILLTNSLTVRQRQQRGGIMERRYLGATIALAATFALFSHGFSSGLLAKLQQPRTTLISEAHCAAQMLKAQLLDKVNRSFGDGSAEEAQLRVEFNIPAPVLAAVPAPPMKNLKTPAPPVVACRASKLSADIRLPKNFDRIVQTNVERAVRAQQMVVQAKLQSREFQRAMALQSRELQRAMANAQREMARAGVAQARATAVQMRLNNSHPCPERRTARVSSDEDAQDIDWGQFSREIEQEVSRSIEVNVRNF